MKKQIRSATVSEPNRKHVLKQEYLDLIKLDFNLRERISKSIGGSPNSQRRNAKNNSLLLLDINALVIIAKYYDKELFDILKIDNSKPY